MTYPHPSVEIFEEPGVDVVLTEVGDENVTLTFVKGKLISAVPEQ